MKLRQRAAGSIDLQQSIRQACSDDILFFINALCWLYEPRIRKIGTRTLPHKIPFISRPHQDVAIIEAKKSLGERDIGIEKSRDEGATWIGLILALHDWLFVPLAAIGLVSRNERAVDAQGDPDSLMWKLDWELDQLPRWMVPSFQRSSADMSLVNRENGSTILGYSCTGDVARGGRKRWFFMDELAAFRRDTDQEAMDSTQYVSDSRLIVSTPKGSHGAYYDAMHEESNILRLRLAWWDNPTKNRGLYRYVGGKMVVVDPSNPLPKGYEKDAQPLLERLRKRGFTLENRLRSPWYDGQCDRPKTTPQSIAQELDIDYGGSEYRIYGEVFRDHAMKNVRTPVCQGEYHHSSESLEGQFERSRGGPLSLWINLENGKPPFGAYTVGCDISSGLGGSYTSNSVIQVLSVMTGEQVAEWVSNSLEPTDFADLAVAVCRWFHDAYFIWEINGPSGAAFTRQVINRKYPNMYHREVLWQKSKKRQKFPGWNSDEKTRAAVLHEMGQAVRLGRLKMRSEPLLVETGFYVMQGGQIVNTHSKSTSDESSRGQAHGDRVIAFCLAWHAVRDRPPVPKEVGKDRRRIPPNCMAARQRAWEDQQALEHDEWQSPFLGGARY